MANGAELGKAYVNIHPKAEGIRKELEDILGENMPSGKAGKRVGKNLGSGLVSGLKAVLASAAIGTAIKATLQAGADIQQSFGGLDTIYEEAAEAAKQYAYQAAQAGISANSYAEQAVSFGAALKQAYGGDTTAAMEAANKAILSMADNSAKMGTPIESIQQAYQGFARGQYQLLDNLKLGYGGTKSEMERLLKRAQEISGVEYNIDNLGDVYEAIHVIQEELGIAGVAALEAETTMTGSFNSLKASWTNTMAALSTGQGLEQAMQNLGTSIGNVFNNLLPLLQNVINNIPVLLSGLGKAISANGPQLLHAGLDMMEQLAIGTVKGIGTLLKKLPDSLKKIGDAFLNHQWSSVGGSIIGQIIGGVLNGISGLISAVVAAVKQAVAAAKGAAEAEKQAEGEGSGDTPGNSPSTGGSGASTNSFGGLPAGVLASVRQEMQRAGGLGGLGGGGADLAALIRAIESRPVEVTITGEAGGIFRVVRTENNKRARATGYNALAGGLA